MVQKLLMKLPLHINQEKKCDEIAEYTDLYTVTIDYNIIDESATQSVFADFTIVTITVQCSRA